jgi:hypothetical protein
MITKTFDRPRRSAIYRRRLRVLPALRLKGLPGFASVLVWFAVPVLMLFLLLARNGALVAGAAASYPDPFAAHPALMPGQPVQAVEGSTCNQGSPREPNKVCAVYPQDGLFHLISFTEKQGGIVETSFYSESLQLGSLLEQWGEPDTIRRNASGRTFTLVWDSPLFSASAMLIPNGYEGYVRLVTVKATAGIY